MGQSHGVESRGERDILSDSPEGCLTNIISFTSPRDACVLASTSKTFESLANSDIVWEKFLPQDYKSLVPRWPEFSTKKELYLSLCDDPVLIDDGKKRLWLDKASGKRCIMLPAMDLYITWGEDLRYWHWYLIPEARFGRTAELIKVCWFEILGRMNTHLLSPATRYSAYIVFKKGDGFGGFKDTPVEAIIEEVGKEPSRRFICFDEAKDDERNIVKPEERKDGWMEVELGEFFTEGVLHNDEIEIHVLEIEELDWKHGLIILGIEIRPTIPPRSLIMEVCSGSTVKEMPPQDQVYLNYRADLRRNFISHLNRALVSENINVFWDGGEEHKSLTVNESLRRIEESRIALAIFSPKYTESVWCIKELDMIMDCTVKGSLVTIPIFYKVEPSKVKLLEGDFGYKFKRLADGNAMEEKWAAAFKFVCNIKGITVDGNSNESDMIDRIVTEVKRVLKQIPSEESQQASSSVDPSENIDTGKYGIRQRLKVCSVSAVKEMPPQDQVYLNYRADLRRNFVSHLTRALISENINAFWDGGEEHKGLTVKESLRRIEESRIALAIFSPKYPESVWCIKELDRITECTVKGSLVPIPIFYKVDPFKVKLLEGDFGDKFKRWAAGHVMKEKWEEAFRYVSTLMGFTVDGNSNESDMIDRIVTEVKRVLRQSPAERTKPVRSSSSDAKTNIDVPDSKIIPPQIQVFINFRGVQLRNNFVGYLVHALRKREVNVFIDNYEQRGEDLNTLFKRIEDSGIAIVVFSSMYTESKWCLDELVKIKERVHQGLLKVIPIFYKVSPTDVKRLKGEFGDHLRDKEHRYGSDSPLIKAWKEAIVFVTHKHALVYDEKSGALEIDFVETILKEVLEMLQSISTSESSQSSN